MARKEETTGRTWVCPRCGFLLPEASVEYTQVSCSRTLKCKHGGGATAMKLQSDVVHS